MNGCSEWSYCHRNSNYLKPPWISTLNSNIDSDYWIPLILSRTSVTHLLLWLFYYWISTYNTQSEKRFDWMKDNNFFGRLFLFKQKINYYQIQQFVYKNFVVKNYFFIISTIKEFIFKNWKRSSCRTSFS